MRCAALPLHRVILPCSLLLLTLRVAAIPSAATICSTACASPASLRHAGVPEALIAAGEPRHAEAGVRHSWPHRPLRGLDGSASLAVPVRRARHLQGRAVGPEGCVRERQPACVRRQRHVLVCSYPCCFAPAPVTPCLSALHGPRPRRLHHAQGSRTLPARAALYCWSRGASVYRKSLSRPWRTWTPLPTCSACSCLAPTAAVS